MGQVLAALDATWRILLVGIVLGAGLPTLFALGVRTLAWADGGDLKENLAGTAHTKHPWGRVVAYALFTIVVLCILGSIAFIVASGFGIKL